MESFGRYLVQQRELRGLDAADVARQTRLSPTAIAALETDRFDQLPARVFVVGYLRAYASCIGLGPDEVIARYDEWRQRSGLDAEEEVVEEPPRRAPGVGLPWAWLVGAGAAVALLLWWLV